MKRSWKLPLLALAVSLVLSACAPAAQNTSPAETGTLGAEALFTAGTYTAKAPGKGGDVEVEVVFSDSEITSVRVLAHNETKGLADEALPAVPAAIVENQSVGVDAVSGVTLTSDAILEAVRDCIRQAGADPADFSGAAGEKGETAKAEDTTTQVLVVGAGPAGMTAAYAASQAGCQVLLLEKTDRVGGAGSYAHSNFPVATSQAQTAVGANASYEDFYKISASENRADLSMVELLISNSSKAADWLIDNGADLGAVQKDYNLKPADGTIPGYQVCTTLKKILDGTTVELRLENEVTELLYEDGKVCGAKVKSPGGEYEVRCGAVVLATGGFSASQEMLGQYTPYWGTCGTDNPDSSTGDGIRMAEAVGAKLTHMDHVRVSLLPDSPAFMALRSGAILVNREGERFVNELDDLSLEGVDPALVDDMKRAHNLWMSLPVYCVAEEIVQQTGGSAYLVMDQSVVDANPVGQATLGLYQKVDTLEELAAVIDVDKTAFAGTIERYQGFVSGGKDEDWGKSAVTCDFTNGPFYYAEIIPVIHSTFGGIAVDADMHALDGSDTPIPGLYAAGETADDGTYALTPLPRAVTFGGLAGQRAADELAK